MISTDSPLYVHAFERYLRKGTPIALSMKVLQAQQRTIRYYIWRTRGDGNVRSSHAANDGKVFAWDNPPATGNPGDDYGCRCWAEPYYGTAVPPALLPAVTLLVHLIRRYLENKSVWDDLDMSLYFYVGAGQPVTLEKLGHLDAIKRHYEANYQQAFRNQIIRESVGVRDGKINVSFSQSYDFKDVMYSYGNSGVLGKFEGNITTHASGKRVAVGNAELRFDDSFKDPVSIAQLTVTVRKIVPGLEKLSEQQLSSLWRELSNLGGTPYAISGSWSTRLSLALN